MQNELKPCPFCGSTAKIIYSARVKMYFVVCDCCGAIVSFKGKEAKSDLRGVYNSRADEEDIVYCQDCKFLEYGECRILRIKAGGTFYCYHGERKEE